MTWPEADTDRVKFDLERPTERQLHEGLTCGLIAESIVIPVLVLVTLLDHQTVRWGYIAAAGACIFVSILYLAMFAALTRGKASLHTQANLWFAIVCMALTALACIELAAADRARPLHPGDVDRRGVRLRRRRRRMRIVTDLYAMVLIAWIGWEEGLRGTDARHFAHHLRLHHRHHHHDLRAYGRVTGR